MPGERLSMRKIREVLRLRFGHGLSQRAVARSLQLSAGAVNGYLSRARRAGIAWPVPDDLDDEQLERRLFPLPADVPVDVRPVPDWAVVHRELRRPNMTLALLLGGIPRECPGWVPWLFLVLRSLPGVGRTAGSRALRQVHVADERMFVDFAGQIMEVFDGATGEARQAEVFVAVAGRVQLHLRRGGVEPVAAGLDRHTRQCAHILRRRSAADRGLRQSALRHYACLFLRTTGELDLRADMWRGISGPL